MAETPKLEILDVQPTILKLEGPSFGIFSRWPISNSLQLVSITGSEIRTIMWSLMEAE